MGVAAVLRPGVPMGFIDGVPFVAALGAAEAMGAHVAWPHDVVGEDGEPLAHVATRAGYDDEGIYVTCELEEYFDACLLLGKPVAVVRNDGSVACEGTLAGMDIWGRVTVKLVDGRDVEIAPGQASVRAL